MIEKNFSINELINSYNELTISDKRKEIGREITETTIVIKKLLNDIGGGIPGLNGSLDEFENLYDGHSSEAEYLTGLYEDIINLKELLGIYLSKIAIDNYKQ